jgi:GT2 family glycosyltransferase
MASAIGIDIALWPKDEDRVNMQILVGIVTHNRGEILPKALDSALAQTSANISVAVIDDGSSDQTASLAQRYKLVDWEFRPSRRGYMSARNEFLLREGFDFFVSLDDDAWFLKGDEIAEALKHFEADQTLAAIAFDILAPDSPERRNRTPARSTGAFIGCGHMLRQSAVREVGGYVPTPGGYGGEEKDLCLRLIDAGYKVVELPGVHVWHDKSPVARDLAYQHRSGVCNDLAMTVRRTPMLLLPVIVPVKIFRHLRFSLGAGLLSPCMSGMVLFFRSLRSIWRWRRPVRLETLRAYSRLSRA